MPVVFHFDPHARLLRHRAHGHPAAEWTGFDPVGHKIHDYLVDLTAVARHGRQRPQFQEDLHLSFLRLALKHVDGGFDPLVEINRLFLTLLHAGKVAKVFDNLLNSPQPLAGMGQQLLKISGGIRDVNVVAQALYGLVELWPVRSHQVLCLLIQT